MSTETLIIIQIISSYLLCFAALTGVVQLLFSVCPLTDPAPSFYAWISICTALLGIVLFAFSTNNLLPAVDLTQWAKLFALGTVFSAPAIAVLMLSRMQAAKVK